MSYIYSLHLAPYMLYPIRYLDVFLHEKRHNPTSFWDLLSKIRPELTTMYREKNHAEKL